jgi:hypothetical protein
MYVHGELKGEREAKFTQPMQANTNYMVLISADQKHLGILKDNLLRPRMPLSRLLSYITLHWVGSQILYALLFFSTCL